MIASLTGIQKLEIFSEFDQSEPDGYIKLNDYFYPVG